MVSLDQKRSIFSNPMLNYTEELSTKRRKLYALLEESLKQIDDNTGTNENIVDELIQLDDLIRCFQKSLEYKAGVKINIDPVFSVDGPYALGSSTDLSELLRNVDFQKQFTNKFQTSLIEEKIVFQDKMQDLLNTRLKERTASIRANDSSPSPELQSEQLITHGSNTKGKTLHVNKKITSNLIRTNQILRSSVLQTELNLDDLKQQTQTLTLVNDKFDRFTQLAKTSSNLIRAINNSSYRDKQKVYISMAFFVACIVYVLWRRIFKYPIKFFFWICFKFFKSTLNTAGLLTRSASEISPAVSSLDVAAAASSSFDRIMDEL